MISFYECFACMYVFAHMYAMPAGVRRGHQLPWKQLQIIVSPCVSARNQNQVNCKFIEIHLPQLPKCWA